MCVIAVYENNYPEPEDLINMEAMNQHFGGIAWRKDGKIEYRKGINAKEMTILIKEEKIKLPFIVHFRIASIGEVSKELNHPFPISENVDNALSGNCDEVLFHNGTWSDYTKYLSNTCMMKGIKAPNGKISDSRIMAWLSYHYGYNFLGAVIDDNSKVVIFTPSEIIKFGKWHEFKKESVSNTYFDKPQFSQNDFFGIYDKTPIFTTKGKNKKNKKGVKRFDFKNMSYGDATFMNELLDVGYSYDEIDEEFQKTKSLSQTYQNLMFNKSWSNYGYSDYT